MNTIVLREKFKPHEKTYYVTRRIRKNDFGESQF
jgi:hypothetical protein